MTSPLPRRPHWRRYTYALTVRARRIGSITKQAAWRGFVSIYNSDDLTHAASIAYYSLLSFFPFLLLLISVLGVITSRPEVRLATLNFVLRYFPAKLDFVASQLQALQKTRVTLGVFGIVALTWASLGFFSAISTAVNHAWKVERQRSYLKHKFVAFLMMATACVLIILTVITFSASQVVGAAWFGGVTDRFPRLLSLRAGSVNWAATSSLILGVGLIFYFVPNAKVRFRDVWVGAVFTGVLWRGAFEVFSWMTSRNAQIQVVNGSIAVVVLFLMWVYISSVILMFGVEFTAAHYRARRHTPATVTS